MRWAVALLLLSVGCNDTGTPAAPGAGATGFPRSAPYPPIVVDGGTPGDAGTEDPIDEEPGACDTEPDHEAMQEHGSLRDLARECAAFECGRYARDLDRYAQCVTTCVEAEGVTFQCATCYGGAEACTLESSCQPICHLDTCSGDCLDCLSAGKCLEAFHVCKGTDENECAD